ncbi:helix-turn-helix transcriptional regulator [Pelagibius litoralis]|uniref:Helix-turn-helix transcriptional regulator n=1 Tax=Pelagibius litoralis TaxID=374515 RepID=A0A967EZQ8_9PROT|nr:helix-turn-helix transcriptional regulator [Pelagibius litoralis]NIA70458.1 helix-turn-helix transcriptional regulator [Pelagibius litoralis]
MDRIAREMGAAGSHLHLVDLRRGEVSISGMSSMFPDRHSSIWKTWQDLYVKYDLPAYRALMGLQRIGFHTDLDLLDFADEEQHRAFPSVRFNIEHLGIRHRAGSRLNLHDAWFDMVAVQYADDRGPMTQPEAEVGRLIVPHIAKSVEMQRTFGMLRRRYDAVVAALDHWRIGVCIVVQDGSILVTNHHADKILSERDGLQISREGRLAALGSNEGGFLQAAVHSASNTASGALDSAESLFAVNRPSGDDAYLVCVSPLGDDGGELEPGFTGALVAIIDPTETESISTAGMGEIYNLTETEQQVCRLLAEGYKSDDIAEIRSLQLETVRSYVKSILAKTRTHSRADLVRLAVLLNPPIDDDRKEP